MAKQLLIFSEKPGWQSGYRAGLEMKIQYTHLVDIYGLECEHTIEMRVTKFGNDAL